MNQRARIDSEGDSVPRQPDHEELLTGIEAMFFAYRAFTAVPDRILTEMDYGRAHHRALHFISRMPGLTVTALMDVLGITKQSLNRVLRNLVDDGLVVAEIGQRDRRERLLSLTPEGMKFGQRIAQAQQDRMRIAYLAAGPDAIAGFHKVLEAMMDPDHLIYMGALHPRAGE